MKKQNCWEFMQCGLEPNGAKTETHETCPAAEARILNGLNGGTNGGRACWAVSGTFCNGQVEGKFATKVTTCLQCDFYKLVCREQGENFRGTAQILALLRENS